ncbi:FAD-binding oxidoreductase [Virgisporangium aurantiacum]|uniref:FAD-linked oxidase n=1 Tax=Virgisporangium aurantiacum TaxID=175570 RepID=A0A8J4DXH9_9ACTN|nr:FAD-linked oxidase C-terminal domain-containing protein [Virgisporangium aurantiacum]GIJ53934.1 FAD-linked oxidase [Virgisporangium aurantiacum]
MIEALAAACTDLITDPDLLVSYQRDEADLCDSAPPLAVARPTTTDEVARLVAVAAAHRIPVVPQGARTGLAGGANAGANALVISMTRMNRILGVDPANRTATVQAGVINRALREAAREHGLTYPPDPGSWETSTIGGNVATNAGGMCCVKYGVTAEYVLALTVVLADGEVLRCGRQTAKGVAGYDLARLFVGSEGTLGVITEVTVKLRPQAEPGLTLVAEFPSVAEAGAAVARITAAGLTPSLLELLDGPMVAALEAYRPMGLDTGVGALLLASADTGSKAADDLDRIAACCGSAEVHRATDAEEADALLAARRNAHPALEHLAATTFPGGGGAVVVDDVAVPRSRLVDLIEGIARIGERTGVIVATVGHAGDGNLHPNLIIDRTDPASLAAGRRAFDDIMALGLELGGTVTGEHGVGLLKRDWLERELGPVGLRVHHAVKAALDPAGILNPGKVIAPPVDSPA